MANALGLDGNYTHEWFTAPGQDLSDPPLGCRVTDNTTGKHYDSRIFGNRNANLERALDAMREDRELALAASIEAMKAENEKLRNLLRRALPHLWLRVSDLWVDIDATLAQEVPHV